MQVQRTAQRVPDELYQIALLAGPVPLQLQRGAVGAPRRLHRNAGAVLAALDPFGREARRAAESERVRRAEIPGPVERAHGECAGRGR